MILVLIYWINVQFWRRNAFTLSRYPFPSLSTLKSENTATWFSIQTQSIQHFQHGWPLRVRIQSPQLVWPPEMYDVMYPNWPKDHQAGPEEFTTRLQRLCNRLRPHLLRPHFIGTWHTWNKITFQPKQHKKLVSLNKGGYQFFHPITSFQFFSGTLLACSCPHCVSTLSGFTTKYSGN